MTFMTLLQFTNVYTHVTYLGCVLFLCAGCFVNQAQRCGRVDAYIQSTDKNFMVPVGGAVVAGFDTNFVDDIAKTYPGMLTLSIILYTLWMFNTHVPKICNSRCGDFDFVAKQPYVTWVELLIA